MNQLDSLTITNHFNSCGSLHANFSHIADLTVTGNIYLGSHIFKAQQLGDLLALLLTQHPELNL